MRRVSLILVLALIPAVASADRHKAGAGGGGRWSSGSELWGLHLTADLTLNEARTAQHLFVSRGIVSVVAEIDTVYGERDQMTLQGGLRYTLNRWPSRRHNLFVQGLVGAYLADDLTSLGGSVGVGMDFVFSETGHGWGVRLQYDPGWVKDRSDTWYQQATVAVIYRFEK